MGFWVLRGGWEVRRAFLAAATAWRGRGRMAAWDGGRTGRERARCAMSREHAGYGMWARDLEISFVGMVGMGRATAWLLWHVGGAGLGVSDGRTAGLAR